MISFDCPVDLLEELDAMAANNLLQRTDVVIFAAANLLEFMEGNKRTSQSLLPIDEEDDDFLEDFANMLSFEEDPFDPNANVIPPFAEGEDDGIFLPKQRRKRK